MVGEQQVSRRFRVGLVVVIALVATMIGVFMVGQRANLFRKKFPYSTHFETAAGLVPGNVVMLNGVVVGNVLEVNLSGDPADRTVQVGYDVVRRWAPMLRKGTRASIKTRGLARRQVHRARRRSPPPSPKSRSAAKSRPRPERDSRSSSRAAATS